MTDHTLRDIGREQAEADGIQERAETVADIDYGTPAERVAFGAQCLALYDEMFGPLESIDVETFDMSDDGLCALGQTIGPFYNSSHLLWNFLFDHHYDLVERFDEKFDSRTEFLIAAGFNGRVVIDPVDGFSGIPAAAYAELQEAWIELLEAA